MKGRFTKIVALVAAGMFALTACASQPASEDVESTPVPTDVAGTDRRAQ